jgi:thiol-disulfide isomerase/thioredoxin
MSVTVLLCLGFSCKAPVKSLVSTHEDFSEYYYRISHLPIDSMVWSANNILAPKYLRDLDFLDGYRIPTFLARDISGKVQHVDYKDKLTLLNFWFIACPPCVEEIPFLNTMQETYKGKLDIISICRDAEPEIFEFIMKHPMSYVIIPNARDIIENRFKMDWGYPKNILVGPDGRVLAMTRGFREANPTNYQKIEHLILKYIKG